MNYDPLLRLMSHSLGFLAAVGVVAFAVRSEWTLSPDQRRKADVLRQVTMAKWSLPKDRRASAVTLTLRNGSRFSIKDITVTCSQVTTTGKVMTETLTIPDQIKAHSGRVVSLPSSSLRLSSAAVVSCNVDDIRIALPQRIAAVE
jgi:hypothetical protein